MQPAACAIGSLPLVPSSSVCWLPNAMASRWMVPHISGLHSSPSASNPNLSVLGPAWLRNCSQLLNLKNAKALLYTDLFYPQRLVFSDNHSCNSPSKLVNLLKVSILSGFFLKIREPYIQHLHHQFTLGTFIPIKLIDSPTFWVINLILMDHVWQRHSWWCYHGFLTSLPWAVTKVILSHYPN